LVVLVHFMRLSEKKQLFDLSLHGSDPDSEAETPQAVDESQHLFAFGTIVEVAWAEVLVDGAILEQVVCGGEHRSGYGSDGLLAATPGA
jgi:hypothetical protein